MMLELADNDRETLWRETPPQRRHIMRDGRRAVLAWIDGVGTVLQVLDERR